ncbi:MAG: TRAP transporter small permease [Planctomycetes bacterium]|nr:TRAP transporter small permease [Planctomycetota bacterium]
MTGLQKAGKLLYQLYTGIGILAMGVMAAGVIFSVIMRYFFGISFIFLEEAITFIFVFTTFWAIGACLLENEHIVIDFFINRLRFKNRLVLAILDYFLVAVVNAVIFYYSLLWIQKAGRVVSNAMRIQYKYMYYVMPIGLAIGFLCAIIKILHLVMNRNNPAVFSAEEPVEGKGDRL